jgi:hypothetical protein
MSQTLRPRTINISPVSTSSGFSDPASISCHHEQTRVPQESNPSQDAVHRQIVARLQPWRDTEVDRERHRVPDQDARSD